jgi:hypothetical protein
MMYVKTFFSPTSDYPVAAAELPGYLASVRRYDAAGNEQPLVEVDLGMVEINNPTTITGQPCSPADHISQRLEMHPHASDHPDAPLVRFMPGHEPGVYHYCPTGMVAIKAHLAERGEHGLHPVVMAALKAQLCNRDDVDLDTFRNMGLSFEEIRALPKYQRAIHKRNAARDAPRLAAEKAKADAEMKAATEAAELAARQTLIGKIAARIARHRAKKLKGLTGG